MPPTIRTESHTAGDRTGPVYFLTTADEFARIEVWPTHGFNCIRWQIGGPDAFHDLLYVHPDWETQPVPTRSGFPILFPFPNRIRDGKFTFHGKEFSLPTIDPAKKNAIHGFATRNPWRVLEANGDADAVWITAVFQPTKDAPDVVELWPNDYALTVTHRLTPTALRVEATVENPGPGELPFGLGYHPYFRLPKIPEAEGISRYRLESSIRAEWVLEESLPTGETQPVEKELAIGEGIVLGDRKFDHLFGDIAANAPTDGELRLLGRISHTEQSGALEVWASRDYREVVLFTPPHRQALAIEPYTCPTDAINLTKRGMEVGWQSLPAGETWTATVECRWRS